MREPDDLPTRNFPVLEGLTPQAVLAHPAAVHRSSQPIAPDRPTATTH